MQVVLNLGVLGWQSASEGFGPSGAEALQLGDIEGDGDLDALVLRTTSATLFTHQREGRFTSTTLLDGEALTSADFGDIDGDGDLDILLGADGPQRIWRLEGDTWLDTTQNLGDDATRDVALVDLTGDGHLDALVLNFGEPSVLYPGRGDGLFPAANAIALPNILGHRVHIDDFDGDATLDIAVTQTSGLPTQLWLSDGVGGFSDAGATLGQGLSLGTGDFNGDGLLDVVNAGGVGEPHTLWLATAAGSWAPSTADLGDGPASSIEVGDVDGNGTLDLLFASADNAPSALWLGDGAGTFSPGPAMPRSQTRDLALADLDGDGLLDAAYVGSTTTDIWRGTTRFFVTEVSPSPNTLVASDTPIQITLNCPYRQASAIDASHLHASSTIVSAALRFPSPNTLELLPSQPLSPGEHITAILSRQLESERGQNVEPRVWQFHIATPTSNVSNFVQESTTDLGIRGDHNLRIADFTGDGHMDVFASGPSLRNDMRLYRNDTAGSFVEVFKAPETGQAQSVGDVDNDGDLDLFVDDASATGSRSGYIWWGDGQGNFTRNGPNLVTNVFVASHFADLNADGFLDLIVAHGNASILVYFNDGLGGFERGPQILGRAFNSTLFNLSSGDLDGDGDLDLLISNARPEILLNDGWGGFRHHGGVDVGNAVNALFDADGDGDLDAVFTGAAPLEDVYINDGSGRFTSTVPIPDPRTLTRLRVADFNGDGTLDIAGLSSGLKVYLGDGLGNLALAHEDASVFATRGDAGDIDGDGDIDIMMGNSTDSTLPAVIIFRNAP